MKILIDMNLSPQWVHEFNLKNIHAVHWSNVGKFDAQDVELINWAKAHDYIIFTHDLDFGTALALNKAEKPSVIQVRTQNVTVKYLSEKVISTIKEYNNWLEKGAMIIIDDYKMRIRVLPL